VDEPEREALLRERIRVMDPDRFEQLVYELAHREDERVERVQNPDGGADTILPRGDGLAERVWQAKRFPSQIQWEQCEKSLADSITRWKPKRVTFVFPRDLSERPRDTFDKRLVAQSAADMVTVDHWNLSRLVGVLGRHRELAHRFWPELEGETDKIGRLIEAGGKLDTAQDLIVRAQALGEFADRDKDFKTAVTSLDLDTGAPNFDTLPYMTLEIRGERRRVHVASWVRDGASVEQATVSFLEDEGGQAARMDAVRTLATGKTARVTGGFRAAIVAPEIVKELTRDAQLGPGGFDLLPGEPLTICLEIDVEGKTTAYEIPLRPVPPPPGAAAGWAGFVSGALIELSFTLLEKPAIRASLSLSGELDGPASARAETMTLLHGFAAHDAIRISSDVLFPGGNGVISGNFEKFGRDMDPDAAEVERDFYANVAFIENHLGIDLPIPAKFSPMDLDAAATMVEVLRTGHGSSTFGGLEATVPDPTMVPGLPAHFVKQGPAIHEVIYPLFAREISLGPGEYPLPPLKIAKFVALGTTPNAPARVRLEADGDPEITFRLCRGITAEKDE
jgi:hypothetical protein